MTLIRFLPNAISIGRVACAPVVIGLITAQDFVGAFWLFVVAGVSDALDGALARLSKVQSVIGSYLDPLADKVLLDGMYVSLAAIGSLGSWLAALVVLRDTLLCTWAARDWIRGLRLPLRPLVISKINTLAQIVLVAVVLADLGFGRPPSSLTVPLAALVTTTTLLSGFSYAVIHWRKTCRRRS